MPIDSPADASTQRTQVTLRRATTDDAPALALVGAATFLDAFAGTLHGPDIIAHCAKGHAVSVYDGWLRSDDAALWIAETGHGAAPVGYAVLAKATLPIADPRPDDLELKRIYVLTRFHGSGVGARLMAAAVDEARARGAGRLLLGVYRGNARALAFYARQGFARVGERTFQVGGHLYEDFILGRPLA